MNQQPSQQNGNSTPSQNANGNPQQAPQQRIVLQPAQIHSLTESYRNEIAKASEVGNQTEEGQEHLKRARRIRLILLRFQEQQRLQRQQQQGAGGTPQPASANTTPVPQQGTPVSKPQQLQQQQQAAPQQQQPSVSRQQSLQNVPQQQQQQQQNISRQQSLQNVPQQLQQQQQQQQQQKINAARQMNASPIPQQQQYASGQGQMASTPQPPGQGRPIGQQAQQGQQPHASILQLQKIRKILDDFHGRLRAIENTKRSGTLGPDELARLVQQENLLKERYDQYTKAAVQMSQQIQARRAQLAAANSAGGGQDNSSALQQQSAQMATGMQAGQQNLSQQQARGSVPRTNSQQGNLTAASQQLQQQQMQQMRLQQQQQQAAAAAARASAQSPAGQQPQSQQSRIQTPEASGQANIAAAAAAGSRAQQLSQTSAPAQRTPASTGRSASPGQSSTPVTSVNAAARPSAPAHGGSGMGATAAASVVKSPVPTIPISSTINVPAIPPTTMKGARPTSLGGGAFNSLALTQPASYKLPQFEMEGDRVLHKRKLKELVRSVGSDEGDGETTIDGDVEELLLDLADEFVTNVTSFACRLAKHRKVDNIDVKDIQLHLEKNWNIRIPGFSSDEIRTTRRFQPTPSHNQKIAGVEIARSVKKDGN